MSDSAGARKKWALTPAVVEDNNLPAQEFVAWLEEERATDATVYQVASEYHAAVMLLRELDPMGDGDRTRVYVMQGASYREILAEYQLEPPVGWAVDDDVAEALTEECTSVALLVEATALVEVSVFMTIVKE